MRLESLVRGVPRASTALNYFLDHFGVVAVPPSLRLVFVAGIRAPRMIYGSSDRSVPLFNFRKDGAHYGSLDRPELCYRGHVGGVVSLERGRGSFAASLRRKQFRSLGL